MTAREHLESYQAALRDEECLREELAVLRARWTSISSPISDTPRGGGKRRDLSDYAAAVDGILRRLDAQLGRAVRIREEILQELARLKPVERETLYRRYIIGESWDTIAEALGYEWRSVMKIHQRALEHYQAPDRAA